MVTSSPPRQFAGVAILYPSRACIAMNSVVHTGFTLGVRRQLAFAVGVARLADKKLGIMAKSGFLLKFQVDKVWAVG